MLHFSMALLFAPVTLVKLSIMDESFVRCSSGFHWCSIHRVPPQEFSLLRTCSSQPKGTYEMFVEVSISIGVHIPEVNWIPDRVTRMSFATVLFHRSCLMRLVIPNWSCSIENDG